MHMNGSWLITIHPVNEVRRMSDDASMDGSRAKVVEVFQPYVYGQ
jgi:hypothetical protein